MTMQDVQPGTPLQPGQQYNNSQGTDPSGPIPYDGAQWQPSPYPGVPGHWAGQNVSAPYANAPAPQGNGLDDAGLLAAVAQQGGGNYQAGATSAGNALLGMFGGATAGAMAPGGFTQAVNASGSNQVLQMASAMLAQGKTPDEVNAEIQRQGALYGGGFLDGAP